MKNKLLILVSSLVVALGLTGCGNNKPESNNNSTEDNSSFPSGGEDSSGNGGSSIDDPTASKENMKSEAEIRAAIGNVFKVSADSLPAGTPSTSASDGTYHYATSRVKTGFYKKIGEKYYQYTKEDGSTKYNKLAGPVTGLDVIARDNVGGLFMYAGVQISYKSKESVTFLNRPCTKYNYQGDSALGYNQ